MPPLFVVGCLISTRSAAKITPTALRAASGIKALYSGGCSTDFSYVNVTMPRVTMIDGGHSGAQESGADAFAGRGSESTRPTARIATVGEDRDNLDGKTIA